MRNSRRLIACVAVAVAAWGAACGGSGGGSANKPGASSAEPVAQGEKRAPERAAITQGDIGTAWTEKRPAKGYDAGSDSCARKTSSSLDALVPDGRYESAVFQRGTTTTFGRTTTLEFKDQTAAKAFVEAMRANAYNECRTAAMTAELVATGNAPEGASWRTRERGDALGAGVDRFELSISYQFQALVNGSVADANGATTEIVFRDGPVVSVALLERVSSAEDPPDVDKAQDELVAAARAGLDRART